MLRGPLFQNLFNAQIKKTGTQTNDKKD